MEINMSKMGQAVFEAQEFATENYNVSRDEFVKLAEAEFLKKGSFRPWMKTWAIEEFDVIQNDMTEWSRYVSD